MMMMTMRGRDQEFGMLLVSLAQGRVSALRAGIRKLIVNPNERVSFQQRWNHNISKGTGRLQKLRHTAVGRGRAEDH